MAESEEGPDWLDEEMAKQPDGVLKLWGEDQVDAIQRDSEARGHRVACSAIAARMEGIIAEEFGRGRHMTFEELLGEIEHYGRTGKFREDEEM